MRAGSGMILADSMNCNVFNFINVEDTMITRSRRFKLILGAAAVSCLLFWGQKEVQAAGECNLCHVMHASQLNVAGTARDTLLTSNCIGCHNDADHSVAPSVYNAGLVNDLAGGNFAYLDAGGAGDRSGHNPIEVGNTEDTVAYQAAPPGWAAGFADDNGTQVASTGTWVGGNKLKCAGDMGCHGTHDETDSLTAMNGAHHNNATGAVAATSVGSSFRFLNRILGYEDADREATNGLDDHNVYYGVDRVADTATDKQTMSYLCAQCHGIFHSNDATPATDGTSDDTGFGTDPWIRHPVDFDMPLTGMYAGYDAYIPEVPVASSTKPVPAPNVHNENAADQRIVMCLSCHRAHASAFTSSLRWDPTTTEAGQGTNRVGCIHCHTNVDDGTID